MEDWEELCKECSRLWKESGLTDEDSKRILKEVREELANDTYENLELQRLNETFDLSLKIVKDKEKIKELYDYYKGKHKRLSKKLVEIKKRQDEDKEGTVIYSYYEGWSKGYYEGMLFILDEILEDFKNILERENEECKKET